MKKRQHPALVTVQAKSRRQRKLTGQRDQTARPGFRW